jgi:hypothetical protein
MVATLLLLVIVLTSGLIAASPLALGLLDRQSRDWERLSWLGQTYGAASALLAVLALIGVAVSLTMQAREGRQLGNKPFALFIPSFCKWPWTMRSTAAVGVRSSVPLTPPASVSTCTST